MKIAATKIMALAGLCAVMVGAGTAAMAQGPYGWHHHHHAPIRRDRHALHRIHAAYARAAAHGNVAAEARLHAHAKAVRGNIRAHKAMMGH